MNIYWFSEMGERKMAVVIPFNSLRGYLALAYGIQRTIFNIKHRIA
jgi:hypothetical protein